MSTSAAGPRPVHIHCAPGAQAAAKPAERPADEGADTVAAGPSPAMAWEVPGWMKWGARALAVTCMPTLVRGEAPEEPGKQAVDPASHSGVRWVTDQAVETCVQDVYVGGVHSNPADPHILHSASMGIQDAKEHASNDGKTRQYAVHLEIFETDPEAAAGYQDLMADKSRRRELVDRYLDQAYPATPAHDKDWLADAWSDPSVRIRAVNVFNTTHAVPATLRDPKHTALLLIGAGHLFHQVYPGRGDALTIPELGPSRLGRRREDSFNIMPLPTPVSAPPHTPGNQARMFDMHEQAQSSAPTMTWVSDAYFHEFERAPYPVAPDGHTPSHGEWEKRFIEHHTLGKQQVVVKLPDGPSSFALAVMPAACMSDDMLALLNQIPDVQIAIDPRTVKGLPESVQATMAGTPKKEL